MCSRPYRGAPLINRPELSDITHACLVCLKAGKNVHKNRNIDRALMGGIQVNESAIRRGEKMGYKNKGGNWGRFGKFSLGKSLIQSSHLVPVIPQHEGRPVPAVLDDAGEVEHAADVHKDLGVSQDTGDRS